MAETDFLVTAGVLPDIESAKKAGAALRAEVMKALSILPGDIRDAVLPYASSLGTARSGQAVYSTINRMRSGVKRGVASLTALDSLSPAQEDKIKEFDELLRLRANLYRRVFINEPINKALSGKRLATKVEDATKALGRGLPSNFVEQYMEAQESGDTKKLAKLERQYRAKAIAARTILTNPGLTTDARYAAAMSVGEVQDEIRNREKQQQDAVKENTKAIKTLSVIATGVVATGLRTFAAALPTYWHENVTRSTFGRLSAEAERSKIYGAGIGTGVGNILGGIIGGAIAGPAGATIGAGILGSAGGTIGGLKGQYDQERIASIQKTISAVNERYRARGIYGGQYGVGYAAAVAETGMASASDVEKMTHNSATLGARMMFGQVGESEMLMYSLMPGYFAAAMSGASSEKLAEAFAADLDKLPPQLRVWAAESVGGGSLGMMAFANSPTFDYVQRNAGRLRGIDAGIMQAGAGFHIQSGVRGVLDRELEEGAVYGDVADLMRKQRAGVYMATGSSAELAIGGYAPEDDASLSMFGLPTKMRTLRKLFVNDQFATPSYYRTAARMASSENTDDFVEGRTTIARTRERVLQTINVNIDGETIKTQENTITEDELNGGYSLSYTLGM